MKCIAEIFASFWLLFISYSYILFMFSYRQNVTVNFVMQELAYRSTKECLEFLEPFSLTFVDIERTSIDCKSSMAALSNIWNFSLVIMKRWNYLAVWFFYLFSLCEKYFPLVVFPRRCMWNLITEVFDSIRVRSVCRSWMELDGVFLMKI